MINLNESSCDLKNPIWLSNSARIEDQNLLPVTGVRYGPHTYELFKANIRIGPLQCQPETEEEPFDAKVEVEDLKEKVNEIVLNLEQNDDTDQDLIQRVAILENSEEIDTTLTNITGRIENIEDLLLFDCPSEPNYRTFGNERSCYYFEAGKKTFSEAQNNCNKKFGLRGGHLAEPQTAERNTLLNKYAHELLNNDSKNYWIGYADLGHGQGNFR